MCRTVFSTASALSLILMLLLLSATGCNKPATDPLAEILQGSWVGDREAYEQANPAAEDGTDGALHQMAMYNFGVTSMSVGTILGVSAEFGQYTIVEEQDNRLTIESPDLFLNPERAEIIFTDADHIRLTWQGKRTYYLKRDGR